MSSHLDLHNSPCVLGVPESLIDCDSRDGLPLSFTTLPRFQNRSLYRNNPKLELRQNLLLAYHQESPPEQVSVLAVLSGNLALIFACQISTPIYSLWQSRAAHSWWARAKKTFRVSKLAESPTLCLNLFCLLLRKQIGLELDKPIKLVLNEENAIAISVYLFDANHCPGKRQLRIQFRRQSTLFRAHLFSHAFCFSWAFPQ